MSDDGHSVPKLDTGSIAGAIKLLKTRNLAPPGLAG